MKVAIHWFRRDLRMSDNTALALAAKAEKVVPVYIVSDWKKCHHWTGPNRQQFLCDSLAALDQSLRHKQGHLVIRQGSALEELKKLIDETGAEAVFFNRDPDPFGRAVEEKLARWGQQHGIEIVGCKDHCLHEREEVLNGQGNPYRVFTPYAKAWAGLDKTAPAPRQTHLRFGRLPRSRPLPTLRLWNLPAAGEILEGGEAAARKRVKSFLAGGVSQYGLYRDRMDLDGTSRVSQDLRFGLISIRELYADCQVAIHEAPAAQRRHAETYVRELIWREFYMQLLWHSPEVLDVEFNPKFRGFHWSTKQAAYNRWCEGQTGFPIVDAAMRQLNETGFMHNRARMITAMFLTKDLQLDWRLGERYFMTRLVDGEIANNNGGWQWSAGTGADAAPYFRIQNPWTQTARFDPDGKYIKRWVPELRDIAPRDLARESDRPLAKGYPAPMVVHAEAREKTLKLFATYRRASH